MRYHDTAGREIGGGWRVARPLARAALLVVAAMAAPGPTAAQPVWHVSQLPAVSIGDGAGENQALFSVRDATVAPDGSILVLNGGSEVRVYSAQGEFVDAIGRRGAGPGEFMGASTLRVTAGGRLLVYDLVGARVTTFAPDEELEDTRPMRYDIGASLAFRSSFRPFADGSVPFARLDVSMRETFRREEGLYEDDTEIHVHDGDRLRRILRRPRGPAYRVPGLIRPVPFEESVLLATGPRTVVVGTSHHTVFQRVDRAGELVGEYTASGSTRRVTARDWALYEDWLREELANPVSLPGVGATRDPTFKVERFLEKTPRGERMPLFDELLLDDEGRLWVREYSLEGDMVAWQAVAPGAGTVGQVELPRDWEVFEFGEDYVLALVRDELDIEIVRTYGIER